MERTPKEIAELIDRKAEDIKRKLKNGELPKLEDADIGLTYEYWNGYYYGLGKAMRIARGIE